MKAAWLLIAAMAVHAQSTEGVDGGKKLFAANCSVGYCHGAEGRAGRGPRLRDREWDRAYLLKVIDNGIPNSSMPAWKGKLSNEQMRSIVAYILSISKEIAPGGGRSEVPGPQPAVSAAATSARNATTGNSAAGKDLFFDSTNDRNCGVCHKVAGAGGDVGPDLTKLASLTPGEIFLRILRGPGRKPVEIVTRDGETLRGILIEENASRVRVYDLTSPGPPVLRSLNTAEIVSRHFLDTDIAHDSFATTYTDKQLNDIAAYLKSPQ